MSVRADRHHHARVPAAALRGDPNWAAYCLWQPTCILQSMAVAGPSAPRVDPSAPFQAPVESADDAITRNGLQEMFPTGKRGAEPLYRYPSRQGLGGCNRRNIPPRRSPEEE